MHLMFYKEWQGETLWYCGDTAELTGNAGKWWAPARMLNISPAEFVELLINKFHPDKILYNEERDVLIYGWRKQADMRIFKNWLNAQARKHNFNV